MLRTRRHRSLFLIAPICLALIAAPTYGRRPEKQYNIPELDDVETQEWKEDNPDPPEFPKDENLLPFQVESSYTNGFFVDRNSVAIGKDGVIRFTTVIKSDGGGKTVRFEGIRCETREKKVYATGRSDNTWSAARSANWEGVEFKSLNGYHNILFAQYFCPRKFRVASAEEAVSALKAGGHPKTKSVR